MESQLDKRLLVFTADSHIAECAWRRHPEIKGDSRRGFSQVVNYCVAHASEVVALVLGGDTFDAKPEADDIEFYLRCVNQLKEAGVLIYAIQGQHGRSRTVPWTSIDPYVIWLHGLQPQPLPNGWHLSGIDNLPPDMLQEAIKLLDPKTDILVMHQAARGSLPEITDTQNWDLDPNWVPRNVKLVLLGDIHKIWETRVEHPADQLSPASTTTFMYSGSTAMQDITEDPRKSFIVVDLKDNTITRESINTRPFMFLTATNEDEVQAALATIKKQVADTLIVLRYDSRIPEVEERCRDANKQALFIFRLLPLEQVVSEAIEAGDFVPERITLDACLDRAIDRTEKPQLHALVHDLLTERNSRKTLSEHKSRILGVSA